MPRPPPIPTRERSRSLISPPSTVNPGFSTVDGTSTPADHQTGRATILQPEWLQRAGTSRDRPAPIPENCLLRGTARHTVPPSSTAGWRLTDRRSRPPAAIANCPLAANRFPAAVSTQSDARRRWVGTPFVLLPAFGGTLAPSSPARSGARFYCLGRRSAGGPPLVVAGRRDARPHTWIGEKGCRGAGLAAD